ncbi:hypothetical protein D3C85_1639680 [compost metagenome]
MFLIDGGKQLDQISHLMNQILLNGLIAGFRRALHVNLAIECIYVFKDDFL